METFKKVDNYEETAEKILSKNHESFSISPNLSVSDYTHLVKLGASVMLTRDEIVQGGSFVQSIVNNDLEQAISRADNIAYTGLKYFVYLKNYVHFDEDYEYIK